MGSYNSYCDGRVCVYCLGNIPACLRSHNAIVDGLRNLTLCMSQEKISVLFLIYYS